MKKISVLFVLFSLLSLTSFSQRSEKVKECEYKFLKGETALNIVFDYEGMTVGKKQTEAEYIEEKVATKNKKKPGSGDKWRASWEKGKLSIYEPTFKASFAKKLGKIGIKVSEGDDAKLTLIVRPTRIEPGFNAGVTKMNAIVDFEFIFVETANKENIVAQLVLPKVLGSDSYTVSDRVNLAFNVAGRKLSGYIAKRLKK